MDWNNDGRKDLIAGEHNGFVRIYLNTNTDEDPVFDGYTFLQVGGSDFDCGYDATPHIVDWNKDGKKDVLCGNSLGGVQLLINVGSDANPVFDDAVFLKDGDLDLDAGYYVSPTVADWNCDGKKDLLVGNSIGKIYYYENKGTDDHPVFDGSILLAVKVYNYAHIDVADWDGDATVDILSGVGYGYVYFFRALGPLSLDENRIHESIGGQIIMSLDAGTSNANRNYIVLGTLSGTSPGTPLPGGLATLPLNWDVLTDIVLLMINSPVFSNFLGTLDAAGTAFARLNAPPVPGLAGFTMHYAYCLNNPFDFVSNPVAIEVVP
ncbi:MAG: FG-GAP repeat domain-containing protein [Planctomycetota bacterium]